MIMILQTLTSCILILGLLIGPSSPQEYTADWDSLDSRPLPPWFDEAKIGIFLHWGLYSVPSYGSEWFWAYWKSSDSNNFVDFMNDNYRPGFTYQDFGPQFTAEFYNPDDWADLFVDAGAKYVVLTSKHHEGFTMWPSKYSWNWNVKDLGPNRDLLGDLAASIRNRTDLHFGIYYSLYEWYNPLYLQDKANNFQTTDFVDQKMLPSMYEIINAYEPEVFWADGDWEAYDTYFNSTTFLSWLFNDSPVKDTIVVNDRWGIGDPCNHGSFYSCEDRFNPGVLQTHKWENAMTLDTQSWAYRREAIANDYLSINDLLETMAMTISCGGNLLVNTGPTHDGRIVPIMEERLRQMGEWLSLNGEAIYSSKPWIFQNDTTTTGVWYTQNSGSVYAIVLSWPEDEILDLGVITPNLMLDGETVSATMVGSTDKLEVSTSSNGITISLPTLVDVVGKWAWVVKMDGLLMA